MVEYEFLESPIQKDVYYLSDEETQKYFEWFIAQCPISKEIPFDSNHPRRR